MNKKPMKNILGNKPKKMTIKPKINRLSKESFSSIKSFQTETKSLPKSKILNSSSIKKKGISNFQQVNSDLCRVKNSIFFLNKSVKRVGEKAESQNNKLEEIKKEQVETKNAINNLKEEQKKTTKSINELKVEQAKTTNLIKETNKLLTELITLLENKEKINTRFLSLKIFQSQLKILLK